MRQRRNNNNARRGRPSTSTSFTRKLWCNKTITVNNASSLYDFGMAHISFNMNDFFGGTALIAGFDQFKVTRCRAFASLGANTTLHDVNTMEIFTATDFDNMYSSAGRGAILSSNLCRKHTFRPNDSPLIASFVPKTVINDKQISNQRINTGSWGTVWHGFNVLAIDFSHAGVVSNQKTIAITLEVSVQLTQPNPNNAVAHVNDPPQYGLSQVHIDNPEALPSDIGGDIGSLRTDLLNGTYFPVDMLGHSIGNMGFNTDDYVGAKFRDQATQITYEINVFDLVAQTWSALIH